MRYTLVVFDMDGTLVEERLDFDAIRAEIGLPASQPILEAIAAMAPDAHARAQAILARHEAVAASASALHDGAPEVLAALRGLGVRTALLTRNSRPSTATVLRRHNLRLDYLATREDAPHKPHPDSILNITRNMGVPTEQTLMVGDYLYDVQAAAAAGVDSALLCLPHEPRPDFYDQATYAVASLRDILAIVHGDHPRRRNNP